jgi:hypothetical protein
VWLGRTPHRLFSYLLGGLFKDSFLEMNLIHLAQLNDQNSRINFLLVRVFADVRYIA